jgi:hypothetical protein
MSEVSATMGKIMMETPTGKLSKEWPEPQGLPAVPRQVRKDDGHRL